MWNVGIVEWILLHYVSLTFLILKYTYILRSVSDWHLRVLHLCVHMHVFKQIINWVCLRTKKALGVFFFFFSIFCCYEVNPYGSLLKHVPMLCVKENMTLVVLLPHQIPWFDAELGVHTMEFHTFSESASWFPVSSLVSFYFPKHAERSIGYA